MAQRDRWRDQNFRLVLAGAKPSREPDFGLDPRTHRTRKARRDDVIDFEQMKAQYKAKNCDPEGRKFPGTL